MMIKKMTKKMKAKHIKKIKAHLLSLPGHKEDKFGHIKSELMELRYKFQKTSIRIEKKYNLRPGWRKITGGYYKNIIFSDNPNVPGEEIINIGTWKIGKKMTNCIQKYTLQLMILVAIPGALMIPHKIINVFGTYINCPINWICVFMLSILFLIVSLISFKK